MLLNHKLKCPGLFQIFGPFGHVSFCLIFMLKYLDLSGDYRFVFIQFPSCRSKLNLSSLWWFTKLKAIFCFTVSIIVVIISRIHSLMCSACPLSMCPPHCHVCWTDGSREPLLHPTEFSLCRCMLTLVLWECSFSQFRIALFFQNKGLLFIILSTWVSWRTSSRLEYCWELPQYFFLRNLSSSLTTVFPLYRSFKFFEWKILFKLQK